MKSVMKMRKREREIRIRVTEKEYQNIKTNAEKTKMQVAPYIRMVAQNPTIIQYDYSIIENHTKEISRVRNEINKLIFTIEATNNYLPKQIDSIVEYMEEIFEIQNKLLRELRNERIKEYDKNRKKKDKI